ncbi:hypothetical protein FisN_7Hu363 [Fistulifera solaris]|uniref:Uncharacterized protein n=1 Tax=Fistulifera solaris TaxID=1519565 RepID=A0A1Z5KSH5_FISSO|nr:hypothetical protein FisN_7Hu363 [Fistulifera solaris]|eukprot:GAX29045.1 hypothetical protein FisN_7Hu363 [Fistulifera solaris]
MEETLYTFSWSASKGLYCRLCGKTVGSSPAALLSHMSIDGEHAQKGLCRHEANIISNWVIQLNRNAPKKKRRGYHCFECKKVAFRKCNLKKHVEKKGSRCAFWDIGDAMLWEDTLQQLSLAHLPPPCTQGVDPLLFPTLYCEPDDIEKSLHLPGYRDTLLQKSLSESPQLLARTYWEKRKQHGRFVSPSQPSVPLAFYESLIADDEEDDDSSCASAYPIMSGAKIFDLTDPNGKRSEVVEVLLCDGEISTIKIVNASSYTNLLDVSVKLGQALSRGFKHGHIRKGENLGRMFALGHNWKTGRM